MIQPEYIKIIKQYLGGRYSPIIIAECDKKGFKNSKGNSYLPDSIQKIAKGIEENLPVEDVILKLIEKKKKAIEKRNLKQKEILK